MGSWLVQLIALPAVWRVTRVTSLNRTRPWEAVEGLEGVWKPLKEPGQG
jgi:hypothetical protein